MQAVWFEIEIETVSKAVASIEEQRQAECQAQELDSVLSTDTPWTSPMCFILQLNQRTPDYKKVLLFGAMRRLSVMTYRLDMPAFLATYEVITGKSTTDAIDRPPNLLSGISDILPGWS